MRNTKKPKEIDYIKMSDACLKYSVSRWTIRRHINENNILTRKIGRETEIYHPGLKRCFQNYIMDGIHKVPESIYSKLQKGVFITMKCNCFCNSKYFSAKDQKGQNRWIKNNKKIFLRLQEQFKAKIGNAQDPGKLMYERL